jgi:hypothetical protein
MYDLIYLDEEHHAEVQELIRKEFPAATFADASDEIHAGRFEVTILDAAPDDYHRHLLRNNLGGNSLGTQLWWAALTPKRRAKIAEAVAPVTNP